jgi:hypothetical protein
MVLIRPRRFTFAVEGEGDGNSVPQHGVADQHIVLNWS